MEESKFLEAQNLKNQIHYLENCLDDFLKRDNAVIGISWPVAKTEYSYAGSNTYPVHSWTENHVEALPKELQEQIKELIQNKLDKLKQEFELL